MVVMCVKLNGNSFYGFVQYLDVLQYVTVATRKVKLFAVTRFSSDRQHLSYDGCLEVRGEIIRTVLCCIVY